MCQQNLMVLNKRSSNGKVSISYSFNICIGNYCFDLVATQKTQQQGPRMDFRQTIIAFLGIQDVVIEDVKLFKKDLRVEIKVRQKRWECFCTQCGLQFGTVKEWCLRVLKAPPLGIYQTGLRSFNWSRSI